MRQWLLGADHGVGWRRESRVHRAADARARALVLVQRTSDRAGAGTSRGKNDVKTGMTFEGDHVSISINAVEPPESEAEPFGRDTSAVDIASAVAAARAAEQEARAAERAAEVAAKIDAAADHAADVTKNEHKLTRAAVSS